MTRLKGQGKLDEFAFVLLAGLIIIIVMLLVWGIPTQYEIPTVNPISKSLSIERGESEDFILEINVTSKLITLTSKGTIADWISFSNNNFEVQGLANVEVTVKVPSGADERDHYGSIIVESQEGGEVTVPLTIKVKEPTEEGMEEVSRTVYVGDFIVSYAQGIETVKTEENIEVGKTTISATIERDISLITEGELILNVFYTNGEGNLVVKFNDQVVHDEVTNPGQLVIPLIKSQLKSYNVIEISTSKPWWRFWTNAVYRIEKMELRINYFGDIEREQTFEVYREELLNFKEGIVSFYVNSYEGPGKLKVEINDYTLYEGVRRGPFDLSFDFAEVGLTRGMNTISFSTEADTSYEIENAKIMIIHEQPES
jgi:hypothetical protein